jgi:hypothetical protein
MDALPYVGKLFTGDRTENVLMVGDFKTNYMARFFHIIGWDRHSQLTQETLKHLAFTLSRDHVDLNLYELHDTDAPVLMDKIPCSVVEKTGVLQKMFLQHADEEYQFGMARIARACGFTVDSDILTKDAGDKEIENVHYNYYTLRLHEYYVDESDLQTFLDTRFHTGGTGGEVPEHVSEGFHNMRKYLNFKGRDKDAQSIQKEIESKGLPEIPVLEKMLQENIDLQEEIDAWKNENDAHQQENRELSRKVNTLSENIEKMSDDIFRNFEEMLNNNNLDSETTTAEVEEGMRRYWTLVKNMYQRALQKQEQSQRDAAKTAQDECGRMKSELNKLRDNFKHLQTAIVNGEAPDEEPDLNLSKMLREIQKMRANNDSWQALSDEDRKRPAASTKTNDTPREYNALKTKLDMLKNAVMQTESSELKDDEDLTEYMQKIKNLYEDSTKWQKACKVEAGDYYRKSVENLMDLITIEETVKKTINDQKKGNSELVNTATKWNKIKTTEGNTLSEYLRRLNAEMFDSRNEKLKEWSAQSEIDSTGRVMKFMKKAAGVSNPTDDVLSELYQKWQKSYTAIESYEKITENLKETENLPWSDYERKISEIEIQIPLLNLAISEITRLTSQNARVSQLQLLHQTANQNYEQYKNALEKLANPENDKLLQAIDEYFNSDNAKSVSDALKTTLRQLNKKLQKFKDDGVAPAAVADPGLLKYKEVIQELAAGEKTMSEYLETCLQETNLNPEELRENLVIIKNKLDILKKQQIVPAPPEESDSSKYKEVIEKLAHHATTNMSEYLQTHLTETNLQPESLKTDLKSILQKLNDLTKQPPAPAPSTKPASADNLASEPNNVNFDEVMSDINKANDYERKLTLIRSLIEPKNTTMPSALKTTFNDLLRIIDNACNVKEDAKGLNEAHIMLQAVQQMIEMWRDEVADAGSDQDKLKQRLATVLTAFIAYMKKGKQAKATNTTQNKKSHAVRYDAVGRLVIQDGLQRFTQTKTLPQPPRKPQNDDALKFMFVLLNLYQDHAKIKKGQLEPWPKGKHWPIPIIRIRSFIAECEAKLSTESPNKIITKEELKEVGLWGKTKTTAVSFGTLFTEDIYFINSNEKTMKHIPLLCKNFSNWLTKNFETRTNEAGEDEDILRRIKEMYQIYKSWLTDDEENLLDESETKIKGQDTDTEQDKFCKRVAFTYFCKGAIDELDEFSLSEKRNKILCDIAKSLSNRTAQQWDGEDENEVNNKIRSWWTPIPTKPIAGVTPNESPDLILNSGDDEESDNSDGDLDDVDDIEEKLLRTDIIGDFLKRTVLKDLNNISGHRELNQENAKQEMDNMFSFERPPKNLDEFNQKMLKQLAEIAYPAQKEMTKIAKVRQDFENKYIAKFIMVKLYESWQSNLVSLLKTTMQVNITQHLPISKIDDFIVKIQQPEYAGREKLLKLVDEFFKFGSEYPQWNMSEFHTELFTSLQSIISVSDVSEMAKTSLYSANDIEPCPAQVSALIQSEGVLSNVLNRGFRLAGLLSEKKEESFPPVPGQIQMQPDVVKQGDEPLREIDDKQDVLPLQSSDIDFQEILCQYINQSKDNIQPEKVQYEQWKAGIVECCLKFQNKVKSLKAFDNVTREQANSFLFQVKSVDFEENKSTTLKKSFFDYDKLTVPVLQQQIPLLQNQREEKRKALMLRQLYKFINLALLDEFKNVEDDHMNKDKYVTIMQVYDKIVQAQKTQNNFSHELIFLHEVKMLLLLADNILQFLTMRIETDINDIFIAPFKAAYEQENLEIQDADALKEILSAEINETQFERFLHELMREQYESNHDNSQLEQNLSNAIEENYFFYFMPTNIEEINQTILKVLINFCPVPSNNRQQEIIEDFELFESEIGLKFTLLVPTQPGNEFSEWNNFMVQGISNAIKHKSERMLSISDISSLFSDQDFDRESIHNILSSKFLFTHPQYNMQEFKKKFDLACLKMALKGLKATKQDLTNLRNSDQWQDFYTSQCFSMHHTFCKWIQDSLYFCYNFRNKMMAMKLAASTTSLPHRNAKRKATAEDTDKVKKQCKDADWESFCNIVFSDLLHADENLKDKINHGEKIPVFNKRCREWEFLDADNKKIKNAIDDVAIFNPKAPPNDKDRRDRIQYFFEIYEESVSQKKYFDSAAQNTVVDQTLVARVNELLTTARGLGDNTTPIEPDNLFKSINGKNGIIPYTRQYLMHDYEVGTLLQSAIKTKSYDLAHCIVNHPKTNRMDLTAVPDLHDAYLQESSSLVEAVKYNDIDMYKIIASHLAKDDDADAQERYNLLQFDNEDDVGILENDWILYQQQYNLIQRTISVNVIENEDDGLLGKKVVAHIHNPDIYDYLMQFWHFLQQSSNFTTLMSKGIIPDPPEHNTDKDTKTKQPLQQPIVREQTLTTEFVQALDAQQIQDSALMKKLSNENFFQWVTDVHLFDELKSLENNYPECVRKIWVLSNTEKKNQLISHGLDHNSMLQIKEFYKAAKKNMLREELTNLKWEQTKIENATQNSEFDLTIEEIVSVLHLLLLHYLPQINEVFPSEERFFDVLEIKIESKSPTQLCATLMETARTNLKKDLQGKDDNMVKKKLVLFNDAFWWAGIEYTPLNTWFKKYMSFKYLQYCAQRYNVANANEFLQHVNKVLPVLHHMDRLPTSIDIKLLQDTFQFSTQSDSLLSVIAEFMEDKQISFKFEKNVQPSNTLLYMQKMSENDIQTKEEWLWGVAELLNKHGKQKENAFYSFVQFLQVVYTGKVSEIQQKDLSTHVKDQKTIVNVLKQWLQHEDISTFDFTTSSDNDAVDDTSIPTVQNIVASKLYDMVAPRSRGAALTSFEETIFFKPKIWEMYAARQDETPVEHFAIESERSVTPRKMPIPETEVEISSDEIEEGHEEEVEENAQEHLDKPIWLQEEEVEPDNSPTPRVDSEKPQKTSIWFETAKVKEETSSSEEDEPTEPGKIRRNARRRTTAGETRGLTRKHSSRRAGSIGGPTTIFSSRRAGSTGGPTLRRSSRMQGLGSSGTFKKSSTLDLVQSQGARNTKGAEMESDDKFFNDILQFVRSYDAQKMKDNLNKPIEELKNGADIEDKIIFFFRIMQDSSASRAMLFEQFHEQAVTQMLEKICTVPMLVFLCLNRTVTQHDNLDVTNVYAFEAMFKESTNETTKKMSFTEKLVKNIKTATFNQSWPETEEYSDCDPGYILRVSLDWVSKLLRMNLAHRQYQYDIKKINTIQTEGMTKTKIDLVKYVSCKYIYNKTNINASKIVDADVWMAALTQIATVSEPELAKQQCNDILTHMVSFLTNSYYHYDNSTRDAEQTFISGLSFSTDMDNTKMLEDWTRLMTNTNFDSKQHKIEFEANLMMLYYYIFWSVPKDGMENDVIHLQDSKKDMQQIQRYLMDIESEQKKAYQDLMLLFLLGIILPLDEDKKNVENMQIYDMWHRVLIAPEEDDSSKKIEIEHVEPSRDIEKGQNVWVKTRKKKRKMWISRPIKKTFQADNGSVGFEVEYETDGNREQYLKENYKETWFFENDVFDRGNDIDPPEKGEEIQLQFEGAWCDAIVTRADENQTQSFLARYDPKPTKMTDRNTPRKYYLFDEGETWRKKFVTTLPSKGDRVILKFGDEWETDKDGQIKSRAVTANEGLEKFYVNIQKERKIKKYTFGLEDENVTWKRAPLKTNVDGLENNFFVSDTAQFMARDETAQDSSATQAQYYMINGQPYMVVPDAGQTPAYAASYTTNYHYAGGQMW